MLKDTQVNNFGAFSDPHYFPVSEEELMTTSFYDHNPKRPNCNLLGILGNNALHIFDKQSFTWVLSEESINRDMFEFKR